MSAERARNFQQANPAARPSGAPKPKRQVKVKVHRKAWVTPGEKIMYVVFAGLLLAALTYFIAFSSNANDVNRQLESLEDQISQQEVTNKDLTYEVKELSQPERIIDMAKEAGLTVQSSKVKEANKVSE